MRVASSDTAPHKNKKELATAGGDSSALQNQNLHGFGHVARVVEVLSYSALCDTNAMSFRNTSERTYLQSRNPI